MTKWTKELFIQEMRNLCSREVAKTGEKIISFAEQHSDELTWGRGSEHGTLTFRCESDFGMLPLFHMTTNGQLNIQVNFLRGKELPKMVMRDMIYKLEANFLRDYDPEMYPIDSYVAMDELFLTDSQVVKFLGTMEGCVYRLRQ